MPFGEIQTGLQWGLGLKGANYAKRGPFGAVSALPPWLSGAEELVPIGQDLALKIQTLFAIPLRSPSQGDQAP